MTTVDIAQRGVALRKTLVVLLIVVVAVIIFGGLLFRGNAEKPVDLGYREAGDQFMTAITSNNAESVYNLMTVELQQQKSQAEWIESLNASFSNYAGAAKRFEESKAEDPDNIYGESEGYVLKYRLGSGDDTYVIHLIVRKVADSWMISEFLSNSPIEFGATP